MSFHQSPKALDILLCVFTTCKNSRYFSTRYAASSWAVVTEILWVISGFRWCVNEILALLGYYEAWIGSHRRFATTYWSHLQRPYCLIHEDGNDRLSRNVGNYPYTLRNIPEERRPQPKYCTSRTLQMFLSKLLEVINYLWIVNMSVWFPRVLSHKTNKGWPVCLYVC